MTAFLEPVSKWLERREKREATQCNAGSPIDELADPEMYHSLPLLVRILKKKIHPGDGRSKVKVSDTRQLSPWSPDS